MGREIPLFTLTGVPNAKIASTPFSTADKLGLALTRFTRDDGTPPGDAVLVIHGLTTSTDMFIMPEHYNLVRYLLDHGFCDVWCLDHRTSNRLPVFPGCGHQDVFMGKAVDQDVFPSPVRFMTARTDGVPAVRTGAAVLH